MFSFPTYYQVIKCKLDCREESSSGRQLLLVGDDAEEELRFFEGAIRNTLCLMKCKKGQFGKERQGQLY